MGELHKAKAIGFDFDFEMKRIKFKFFYAGYPFKFMMYQFNKFAVPREKLLIPPGFLEESAY